MGRIYQRDKTIFGNDGVKDIFQIIGQYLDQDESSPESENLLNTDYISYNSRKANEIPRKYYFVKKRLKISFVEMHAMVLKGVDNHSVVAT